LKGNDHELLPLFLQAERKEPQSPRSGVLRGMRPNHRRPYESSAGRRCNAGDDAELPAAAANGRLRVFVHLSPQDAGRQDARPDAIGSVKETTMLENESQFDVVPIHRQDVVASLGTSYYWKGDRQVPWDHESFAAALLKMQKTKGIDRFRRLRLRFLDERVELVGYRLETTEEYHVRLRSLLANGRLERDKALNALAALDMPHRLEREAKIVEILAESEQAALAAAKQKRK
jgi:hypothetical protein